MDATLGLNREWLTEIYLQGLAKVSGKPLVQHWLAQHPCTAPYYLIAVGKAAAAMAAGFCEVAGEHCRAALVITKPGHLQPWLGPAERWVLLESSHPVPDQTSLDAGARLVAFVSHLPRDAKLYVLISGGASSLVEVLRLFRRIMPITPQLHGQRFVVRLAGRTPPR